MTLWHSSSRTLAASSTRLLCRPLRLCGPVGPWRTPLRRSSIAALNDTRLDEPHLPPPTKPSSSNILLSQSSRDHHEKQAHKSHNGASQAGDSSEKKQRHRRRARRATLYAIRRPLALNVEHVDVAATRALPKRDVKTRKAFNGRRARAKLKPMTSRRRREAGALNAMRDRVKSDSTTRPKWIWMRSNTRPSSVVSSVWNRQSTIVFRSVFDSTGSQAKTARVATLDPAVFNWAQHALDQLDKDVSAFAIGSIPCQSSRGQQWMFIQISLWLLQYEPNRMIDFLHATHEAPYPPINWVEDVLCHLAKRIAMADETQRRTETQRLLNLFQLLAQRDSGEKLRCVNDFVRHMLSYCTAEQAVEIYRIVTDFEVQVHGFTLLHLATRCAKEGRFEQAADALLRAKDAGVVVSRGNYRSACSAVIRGCMSQPEGLRVCLKLVSQLVDVGLKLNGPICDIIMLNAVDAGDIDTAFAVYRSLVDRGLKPRESTFAILLKGCKLNIDNADMLNDVIRDAIGKVNVRRSPLVATEILHCLALHHTKHNPETALRTITEAYAQLFDVNPLKQLGLPLPAIQQQRVTEEEAMPPTPHALGFMISASIQSIQLYSQRPDDVASTYTRWREQVEAGHPTLSALATTDHIANIFLMAFIRTPSGLIHASRVVRDMQRPLPEDFTITQCKPTVQTWSIFLHGFTRHGKVKLADQVLTYMRSKGIEPNEVTWNTLILGHARSQDVESTFDTLREAEQSGYIWNRWTEDGIKWLRDRGRVMREMELRRQRKIGRDIDFTDDLKLGLGEKLSAWEEGDAASEDAVGTGDVEQVRYVPQSGFADSAADIAEQRDLP